MKVCFTNCLNYLLADFHEHLIKSLNMDGIIVVFWNQQSLLLEDEDHIVITLMNDLLNCSF